MKPLSPRTVEIATDGQMLRGDLCLPTNARGIVLFAHGSGSSRASPRNVVVAQALQKAGFATPLFDLLTQQEERADLFAKEYRFNIALLTHRLRDATVWLDGEPHLRQLAVGYFGASTGAAAALVSAARLGGRVAAVVSRGGRPDRASPQVLSRVHAAVLLIVGGRDEDLLELNRLALSCLSCTRELTVVPGANHLFEEPGAMAQVTRLASAWFDEHLHLQTTRSDHRALGAAVSAAPGTHGV